MKPNSRQRHRTHIPSFSEDQESRGSSNGVLTQPYLPSVTLRPHQTKPSHVHVPVPASPSLGARVGGMPSAACSARCQHEKESRELHDGRDCGCWKGATRPAAMGFGNAAGRLSHKSDASWQNGEHVVLLPIPLEFYSEASESLWSHALVVTKCF